MIKNYKILNNIHYILLAISVVAIFIHDDITENSPQFTVPLWIALISFILSLLFGFMGWLKYGHLNSDNPIRTMKFHKEYFDKIGYALFTGGMITLVTADKSTTSYGLCFIGLTCMIIAAINKNRLEKFEELKNSTVKK